jgi:NADH-quinone oxidoreductase subunit M
VSILDIIILLPLIGALAIACGAPPRITAIGVTGANLALGVVAWILFDPNKEGFQLVASRVVAKVPEISYAVGIDGLSLIMLLLSVIVSFCAIWMAPRVGSREKLYFSSLLFISAGALGAFCSTDVFFFYAFHELALIPTFFMIGIWGTGEDRVNTAWKITIYLAVGSIVLLAGLIAFQMQLSQGGLTFDFTTLQERAASGAISAEAQGWIFLTLLIGFGILVSLFPFHSWAAPAYASAPAPTSMLHAGVLKKFGLYGLLRFTPMLPEGLETWRNLLLVLLIGNILFVGFVTLAQKHLDGLLGNSSVMHMGYVFLGIASWSAATGEPIGLTGAVLLMFGHGISIALLFGLAGKLRDRVGTLEMEKLGGLGKQIPIFSFLFGLAAFASAGLPGFANFSGEVMVFFGGFQGYQGGSFTNLQWATILALWGVVISAVYMLRAYRSIFLGEQPDGLKVAEDVVLMQRIPCTLLVVSLLVIGFYPRLFSDLLTF